jgi:hypothetical protein
VAGPVEIGKERKRERGGREREEGERERRERERGGREREEGERERRERGGREREERDRGEREREDSLLLRTIWPGYLRLSGKDLRS